MVLGLAVVSVAGLWLATRPSLTPRAQLPDAVGPEAGAKDEPPVTRDEDRRVRRPTPPIRQVVAEGPADRNRQASPAASAEPERIVPQRFHIVRKDETLSEISYAYYGSAGKWRKIFEANRGTVRNADVVKAGTKLIIPN